MKNSNATIIIAEDIRVEIDNHFTLVGITPSRIKLARSANSKTAEHSIASYAELPFIKNAETAHVSIKCPNDEVLTEGVVPIPTDEARKELVFAGKFVNVKFKESGKHKFIIKILEHEFVKQFEIEIVEENQ